MAKTSVQVDAAICDKLAQELGTSGEQETVERALQVLLLQQDRLNDRTEFIAAARAGEFGDIFDDTVTSKAWW